MARRALWLQADSVRTIRGQRRQHRLLLPVPSLLAPWRRADGRRGARDCRATTAVRSVGHRTVSGADGAGVGHLAAVGRLRGVVDGAAVGGRPESVVPAAGVQAGLPVAGGCAGRQPPARGSGDWLQATASHLASKACTLWSDMRRSARTSTQLWLHWAVYALRA